MREFDEAALDCAICLSATTLITVKYPIPSTNVGISHKSALNLVVTLHCSNMPIMKVPNDRRQPSLSSHGQSRSISNGDMLLLLRQYQHDRDLIARYGG